MADTMSDQGKEAPRRAQGYGETLVELLTAVDRGMEAVAHTLPAIGDGRVALPTEMHAEGPGLGEDVHFQAPSDIQSLYARWTQAQEEFCRTAAHLHELRRAHACDSGPEDGAYRRALEDGITALRARRTALAALAQQLRHRVAEEIDGVEAQGMVCPNCGTYDPFPPTRSDNGTTTCPTCGHRFPVNDDAAARRMRDPSLMAAELSHPGG